MTEKIFSYKSPEASDLESNKIEFNFFHNFPCRCAEIITSASSFELKIDKTKLTSAD